MEHNEEDIKLDDDLLFNEMKSKRIRSETLKKSNSPKKQISRLLTQDTFKENNISIKFLRTSSKFSNLKSNWISENQFKNFDKKSTIPIEDNLNENTLYRKKHEFKKYLTIKDNENKNFAFCDNIKNYQKKYTRNSAANATNSNLRMKFNKTDSDFFNKNQYYLLNNPSLQNKKIYETGHESEYFNYDLNRNDTFDFSKINSVKKANLDLGKELNSNFSDKTCDRDFKINISEFNELKSKNEKGNFNENSKNDFRKKESFYNNINKKPKRKASNKGNNIFNNEKSQSNNSTNLFNIEETLITDKKTILLDYNKKSIKYDKECLDETIQNEKMKEIVNNTTNKKNESNLFSYYNNNNSNEHAIKNEIKNTKNVNLFNNFSIIRKNDLPSINKKSRNESKITNYKTLNNFDSNTQRSELTSFANLEKKEYFNLKFEKIKFASEDKNELKENIDNKKYKINLNLIQNEEGIKNKNIAKDKLKTPIYDYKYITNSDSKNEMKLNLENTTQNSNRKLLNNPKIKIEKLANSKDIIAFKNKFDTNLNSEIIELDTREDLDGKLNNNQDKFKGNLSHKNIKKINNINDKLIISSNSGKFRSFFQKGMLSFLIKRSELIEDVIKFSMK